MKKLTVLLLTLAIANASTNAHSAIIAAWNVAGINSEKEIHFDATTKYGPNVANAVMNLGSGVNSSGTNNSYGFSIDSANSQKSLGGAIDNNHYIQFSINLASGYEMNLESIEINGESTSAGSNDIAILSSIAGFSDTAAIASLTDIAGVTGGFDTNASGFGNPIDLRSSEYQNLTGETIFRIYGWNTSTTSSGGVTRIRNLAGDDLVVSGTIVSVPIPEPSMVVLLLFGIFPLLVFRRQKRRN